MLSGTVMGGINGTAFSWMVLRTGQSSTWERAVPYRQGRGGHHFGGRELSWEDATCVTPLALKAKEHILAHFTGWSMGL